MKGLFTILFLLILGIAQDTIKAWKGHYEQTDDIRISGIKHY